ncbi:hypothetical protein CICLE_v10025580mg [Citrus x clementina]|uniref:Uncharacterized protein n=1 Tax=Citrus clementina TaxID=85681 RepID=V4UH80_CITCL|nr:uncharacterized protein LOC18037521 [Citrus x clementina]XP_024036337.1 uncharacterized protein LOC18037521 [Citrus x clementina]ESR38664.1 hypothetical protein CICLE_v10025580mg [Citrus x clementina]
MALSDRLANALEDISTEDLVSWLYRPSSLETTRIIRVTTDYAEDDENPNCTEKDEIRKASISYHQPKTVRIGFPSRWWEKLIDRPTRAEKFRKYIVNLKNSRNGSSHEANVKESSFENFLVLPRMDRETVSDSCHAQDEKIRRASINPISDSQDPADPRLELFGRRASVEQVVIPSLSLRPTHVSRIWYDWESPSLCEINLPTEPRVNVCTERLELELDKPLVLKWKNSRKWPDTLPQVDKLLAHINGWPDLKPYNMFGTTAFRSQPHWGDNGGEKHILQVDDLSHDYSVISPNSVRLASPSHNNASSEDGDGDKQPPPNRSPSDRVASSRSEGQLCFPSLAKICLFLGAEVCVAAPLIRCSTGTSLSEDARTLLFVGKLLGFVGFLLCLGACIVQRSHRASRLMAAMGCAATVCGFLSILGILFPENLMLWLIGALCVLPIAAIPFAFKRSV